MNLHKICAVKKLSKLCEMSGDCDQNNTNSTLIFVVNVHKFNAKRLEKSVKIVWDQRSECGEIN